MKRIICILALVFPTILWSQSTREYFDFWIYFVTDDTFEGKIHKAYTPKNDGSLGLVIGCTESVQRTAFIFVVGSYLLSDSDDEVNVQYKITSADSDLNFTSGPIHSEYWSTSIDSHGVGLWGIKAINLLRELEGNFRIDIRVTERHGEIHDEFFHLDGLNDVLDIIFPACGNER